MRVWQSLLRTFDLRTSINAAEGIFFVFLFKHDFSNFGYCVSIPLIKDKTGNVNDMDNYRVITLPRSLFEMLVLELCSDAMTTDPLRFGFQNNICCADAIVTRKSTIKYFAELSLYCLPRYY